MFYNLSEFITQIKENIGIKDVPLPVDDNALAQRFISSALREFSVRYPIKTECVVTANNALDYTSMNIDGSVTYIIPESVYEGTHIITVMGILPTGAGSASNMYMPNVTLGSADMMLESISDIKMAAALGSMMCHAPTFNFQYPNRLTIYNGWTGTSFRVELGIAHDPSLSTIPPGAFTNLYQLAELDMEEYLYNKMKRKTNYDVGIGSIDIKIDSWENAGREKRELLDKWDDTISLDMDRINWW